MIGNGHEVKDVDRPVSVYILGKPARRLTESVSDAHQIEDVDYSVLIHVIGRIVDRGDQLQVYGYAPGLSSGVEVVTPDRVCLLRDDLSIPLNAKLDFVAGVSDTPTEKVDESNNIAAWPRLHR